MSNRRRRSPGPGYRLHKKSGQAIVTLNYANGRRRDVLLGPYDTPFSRAEYARVIAEWKAENLRLAESPSVTVAEILRDYHRFAEVYYRDPTGQPTNELAEIRLSIRPLRELYGHTPAAAFGPSSLETVRDRMVKSGLSRGVVNQRIGRLKRVFKWAVNKELIPPTRLHALQTVPGLKAGRTEARETEPIRPVHPNRVDAVLPFLSFARRSAPWSSYNDSRG
jgi:hypothetical protein